MDSIEVKITRRANLDTAIKEAGGKVELAKRMGKHPNYLSQVHRPDGPNDKERPIGGRLARNVERAMNWDRGYMDVLHSPAGTVRVERRLPIILWTQVGRLGEEMMDSTALADSDAWVVHPDASIDRRAFALRVQGDSMVSSEGSPSFPDGCIIVVDPSVIAMPGDHVVVRLPAVEWAAFKKLELFDGKRYLKPLNPGYPGAPMPDDAQIIGVVVSVQKHEVIVPLARR